MNSFISVRARYAPGALGVLFHIFLAAVLLVVWWLFLTHSAQASYAPLRAYYDWGPYYGASPSAPRGQVKALTTEGVLTGTEVPIDSPLEGYVEAFPNSNNNPDDPNDDFTYAIGIPGEGLVEFKGDPTVLGINPAQVVGQYIAIAGTVETDAAGDPVINVSLAAPVPPPTDPLLAQAKEQSSTNIPDLPSPGVESGFWHGFELFTEGIVDGVLNLVNPDGATDRALDRAAERTSEVVSLVQQGDSAAKPAVEDIKGTLEGALPEGTDDKTVRDFEGQVAGIMTAVEVELPDVPEEQEAVMGEAVDVLQQHGLDKAADTLDRPPVSAVAVQRLQALKALGILAPEQVVAVYQADSRSRVRELFEGFVGEGLMSDADVKGALDEVQFALYPTQFNAIRELHKLQELARLEAVRPDDATLAKLKTFGEQFTPGQPVPPDIMPFWIASVKVEELQMTLRPDIIPEEWIARMEARRQSEFAKFAELKERFKPSPMDIAALEQMKTQLRQQYPNAGENVDQYLPPQFQRVAAFHDRFGLKEPDPQFFRQEGLAGQVPFATPTGCTTFEECRKDFEQRPDEFKNFAPPVGYGTSSLAVEFRGDPNQEGPPPPPVFPGMNFGGFRPPPVARYVVTTVTTVEMMGPPQQYVGPGGCTNASECIQKFKEIPQEERGRNFFIFTPPPAGAPGPGGPGGEQKGEGTMPSPGGFAPYLGARPFQPGMTPMPGPGAPFRSDGTPDPNYQPGAGLYMYGPPPVPYPGMSQPYSGGTTGTAMPYGQPASGPGAMWNPQGSYSPGWDQPKEGPAPYYPSYSQPVSGSGTTTTTSSGSYTPPATGDSGGTQYVPPPSGSGTGSEPAPYSPPSGDSAPMPPPPSGDSGGEAPPPPSGDSGGEAPPPSGDGGGSYSGDGGGGGGGESAPGPGTMY